MKTKRLTLEYLISELRKEVETKKGVNKVQAIGMLKQFLDEYLLKTKSPRDSVTDRVVNQEKLMERIGWKPHEKQKEILNSKARIKVICAGRGFGKSMLCAYVALKSILENNKKIALIAPTYDLTGRIREHLNIWINIGFKGNIRVFNRPLPRYTTTWGSYIDCLSAEKPEIILGKGYDVVIVDECALIDEKVHNTYIATASREKEGEYYYIGTPKGRNWFWKEWQKQVENGGSFRFKSTDNPYFPVKTYEEMRKRLPEMVFQQEHEAIFLSDALVFKGIEKCLRKDLTLEPYNERHFYNAGVDMGRYETFTAISVVDMMTKRLAHYDQWKEPDWEIIKKRIQAVLDSYNQCPSLIDATSITVGDAYVDELVNEGYDARGYKLIGIPKRQLIENLVVRVQNQEIEIPDCAETEPLIEQMRAFTFSISPTGHIQYHCPSGIPDDGVIALALACWELSPEPLPELKKGETPVYNFPEQNF